jgi:hypothetical protein
MSIRWKGFEVQSGPRETFNKALADVILPLPPLAKIQGMRRQEADPETLSKLVQGTLMKETSIQSCEVLRTPTRVFVLFRESCHRSTPDHSHPSLADRRMKTSPFHAQRPSKAVYSNGTIKSTWIGPKTIMQDPA